MLGIQGGASGRGLGFAMAVPQSADGIFAELSYLIADSNPDSAAKSPTLCLQYIPFFFFTPIHCTRLPLVFTLLWSLNPSLLHHISECAHHLNQGLREKTFLNSHFIVIHGSVPQPK